MVVPYEVNGTTIFVEWYKHLTQIVLPFGANNSTIYPKKYYLSNHINELIA